MAISSFKKAKFSKMKKAKFSSLSIKQLSTDLFKKGLKIYYFLQLSKKAKNDQMAKLYYFWQTVWKNCFKMATPCITYTYYMRPLHFFTTFSRIWGKLKRDNDNDDAEIVVSAQSSKYSWNVRVHNSLFSFPLQMRKISLFLSLNMFCCVWKKVCFQLKIVSLNVTTHFSFRQLLKSTKKYNCCFKEEIGLPLKVTSDVIRSFKIQIVNDWNWNSSLNVKWLCIKFCQSEIQPNSVITITVITNSRL